MHRKGDIAICELDLWMITLVWYIVQLKNQISDIQSSLGNGVICDQDVIAMTVDSNNFLLLNMWSAMLLQLQLNMIKHK